MAYKGSVSRIEKFSRFVLFLVMLILAGFLSALGDKILRDIDMWSVAPRLETFQDKSALQAAQQGVSLVDREYARLEESQADYARLLEKAERQYQAEKQSYSDWLQARSTIGSSQEDESVRSRAVTLDRFRKIQESWQGKLEDIEKQKRGLEQKRSLAGTALQTVEDKASHAYEKAMQAYALKVFFIRLGFVLPVLALGLFFFLKVRGSRFWPLVWGFILFSLYVFFVGLLPYLPSFGGYIRLAVGVVLTGFIGYYVVKQLNGYLARKKAELEESTKERAGKIKDEIAVRAYQSHSCPSCERDFLINKWYPKVGNVSEVRTHAEAPDHCAYCGMPLFGKCPKCGNRNFLHFPFCSACGSELETLKKSEK